MKDVQKQVTVADMKNALKALLRENVVGFVGAEKENEMTFSLPGGKSFLIALQEVK